MAKTDDIHFVTMSVEEWSKVETNRLQRDTESHATKASRPGKHLAKPAEVHRNVSAALLPSGKYIKLDGHSRSWLWDEELLVPAPKTILVTVFPAKDRADAESMYSTFDNVSATESKKDKMFGAFRKHKFFPKHGYLFHNSGLMSAIEYVSSFGAPTKSAVRNLPFHIMVVPWLDTLKVLDSGDFTNHYAFRSPVMCAAILAIRRDGNKALSYFQSYHDVGGDKKGQVCDGIYASESLYRTMKDECENRWGARILNAYVPYFLYNYDQWWNDNKMKPWGNVLHKRLPSDMFTTQEWFQTCIDEKFDHMKEFPQQQELALDEV